jgi:hypothetical protein
VYHPSKPGLLKTADTGGNCGGNVRWSAVLVVRISPGLRKDIRKCCKKVTVLAKYGEIFLTPWGFFFTNIKFTS